MVHNVGVPLYSHVYSVNATAPIRQWAHVATTWKPNGNLKVYINGELRVSAGLLQVRWENVTGQAKTVHVGAPRLPGVRGTNVAVDEIHIFTHEMDQSEIRKYSDVSYVRGETRTIL